MKKLLCIISILAIGIFFAADVFAGSVDYLSNQSAEYIRTFNRNAATDSADAVNYNPAGVMKLQNGLFVNASGQYLMKNYTAEDELTTGSHPIVNPDEYKSDTSSIIPAAYFVYKLDNWAAFAAFTVPAGGGKLEFDKGTPMVRLALAALGQHTNIDALQLSSMYLGGTLGGAYKINDMFSVSLGARYISAEKSIKVTAIAPSAHTYGTTFTNVDLESQGIGGIIGLNVNPIKDVNVGLRYETITKLKWDTSVKAGSPQVGGIVTLLGYGDDETEKKDLPALLALGVSYDILPELKVISCFTYYFIKQAKWEHYNSSDNKYKDYDNGWEAGLALEYKVLPQLLVSVGYQHTDTGGNEDTWDDFSMVLDSNSYALGAKYEVISGLNINLGLAWTKYIDGTGKPVLSGNEQKIKYTKDVKTIALGVEYKIM